MTKIIPTSEQTEIINSNINSVIMAMPGSGKTYVLSEKIRHILRSLVDFKGIIAISYTNKASEELKKRSLKGGINKKSSFFGTIDSFYISEIIIPFGKQLFGFPSNKIITCKKSEISIISGCSNIDDSIDIDQIHFLKEYFLKGIIILEFIGVLANFIFDNSKACRNYLKARYTHLMIDEYQDSGSHQHELFIKISKLDICSIAVGDINQSIYGFSGKDPKFLFSLAHNNYFKLFPLTFNHRSHESIIKYSSALFEKSINISSENSKDIRVFEKIIDGHQSDIAAWLNQSILNFSEHFNIKELNNVAILFKNNFTGSIVNKNLNIKRKHYLSTKLDNDFNVVSNVFKRLLYLVFDTNISKMELFEELLGTEISNKKAKELLNIIFYLEILLKDNIKNLEEIIKYFINVSQIIYPGSNYLYSVEILKEILASNDLINSFKPPEKDEVQLMTIHKSKGLEFDLVFHLDLYKWILPKLIKEENNYNEYQQELNLHYVAITRAKKGCILCTSTKRYNQNNEIKKGNYSDFFYLNNTSNLRIKSKF